MEVKRRVLMPEEVEMVFLCVCQPVDWRNKRARGNRPVHRVTLPDDDMSTGSDGVDVLAEQTVDFRLTVTRYQYDLPDLFRGIDDIKESDELVAGHARADLNADGVLQAAEELDVRAGELARAVTDPEEVRGGVVPSFTVGLGSRRRGVRSAGGRWVRQFPGEAFFVV